MFASLPLSPEPSSAPKQAAQEKGAFFLPSSSEERGLLPWPLSPMLRARVLSPSVHLETRASPRRSHFSDRVSYKYATLPRLEHEWESLALPIVFWGAGDYESGHRDDRLI